MAAGGGCIAVPDTVGCSRDYQLTEKLRSDEVAYLLFARHGPDNPREY